MRSSDRLKSMPGRSHSNAGLLNQPRRQNVCPRYGTLARMYLGNLRAIPGLWWSVLLLLSATLGGGLTALHFPAGILLGCMVSGIILSSREIRLEVPQYLFVLAQGVVGCLMARSLQPSIFAKVGGDWPIFLGATVSIIAASAALGWILMRRQVLPGTTAVWGLAPGAASAMVLMAGEYGADVRLVAFMQYLRVAVVTALASLVARLWAPHPASVTHAVRLIAAGGPGDLMATLALAFAGSSIARWLRIPAGPLMAPLVLGTLLQITGSISIELPSVLLGISYAVIGWTIGLRFTRTILLHAFRALPQVLAAIFGLIGVGLAIAVVLTRVDALDPLTAYLATSPGGADSVAIIAATSAVDTGFVMAMQIGRFAMVLLFGPRLSKFVARRGSTSNRAT